MVNAALTWQQAAVLAAALAAGSAALAHAPGRTLRATSPFAREAGIIAALYSLWQLAGSAVVIGSHGAVERGRWLLRVEQAWHLPSEQSVQRLITPYPLLTQANNWYYAIMHFGALFAFLLWLFARYRREYKAVRNTIAITTALCLAIQLVPVAPPRLLPGAGFVDTAEQYGQSVYSALAVVGPDQLSAMPSVHVAWAVIIGLAVVRISTSPRRWWVMLHPALTIFVVTATANHYWVDGIVAVAVMALVMAAQWAWSARRSRVFEPVRIAVPEPAGAFAAGD